MASVGSGQRGAGGRTRGAPPGVAGPVEAPGAESGVAGVAAAAGAGSGGSGRSSPIHWWVKSMLPWKVRDSATSLAPYMSMTATTLGWSVQPGGSIEAGAYPAISARCPPAEPPQVTTLLGSKLYLAAFLFTQDMAQRTSWTAAGAGASMALRYWTATTLMPAAKNGPKISGASG